MEMFLNAYVPHEIGKVIGLIENNLDSVRRRLGLYEQRQQIGVDGLGQGIEYVHGWLRKLNEPPIYQRAFQKKNALFEQ